MKSLPRNEDDGIRKLSQSAGQQGDSKSVFGLLLRIERELRLEARGDNSLLAQGKDNKPHDRRWPGIFRSYVE
jgi:hypothetical protein